MKAATLTFTITADRGLVVVCENEPGAGWAVGLPSVVEGGL